MQDSEMASTPITLSLTPYGVSVFTDLERGKSFVTLFFRREKLTRVAAFDFIAAVTRDLADVNLVPSEAVKINLKMTMTGYRCHLEVPVQLADGGQVGRQPELLAFAEALRATARKGGASG